VAALLGVGLTTLQRWRRQFAGDGDGLDGRKGSHRLVSHRLTDEERQRILLTCNQGLLKKSNRLRRSLFQ
jgi:transposase